MNDNINRHILNWFSKIKVKKYHVKLNILEILFKNNNKKKLPIQKIKNNKREK